MALSIPIINDIIVNKIKQLENKIEKDEDFYKTTILNLTTQINLLTKQNSDLLNNLEKYEIKSRKNNQSVNFLDKPPGLIEPEVLNKPIILEKQKTLITTEVYNKKKTKPIDKWVTVKKKQRKRRPKYNKI